MRQRGFVLVGSMLAGKDLFSEYLYDESMSLYGVGTYRLAFGDQLKRHHLDLSKLYFDFFRRIGWLVGSRFDVDLVSDKALCRKPLQLLGTELGRDFFGDDVWIRAAKKSVEGQGSNVYVITDCRFLNELRSMVEWGLTPIHVVAKEEDRWLRCQEKYPRMSREEFENSQTHASEQLALDFEGALDSIGYEGFTVTLENFGTRNTYRKGIRYLIETVPEIKSVILGS